MQTGLGAQVQKSDDTIYLGSRVLFVSELAFGLRLGRRVAVEAVFIHLSHANAPVRKTPTLTTLASESSSASDATARASVARRDAYTTNRVPASIAAKDCASVE